MFMQESFVFLFLTRVQFPKSKSVATEVILSRFSEETIKRIQKKEKLDCYLHKAEF